MLRDKVYIKRANEAVGCAEVRTPFDGVSARAQRGNLVGCGGRNIKALLGRADLDLDQGAEHPEVFRHQEPEFILHGHVDQLPCGVFEKSMLVFASSPAGVNRLVNSRAHKPPAKQSASDLLHRELLLAAPNVEHQHQHQHQHQDRAHKTFQRNLKAAANNGDVLISCRATGESMNRGKPIDIKRIFLPLMIMFSERIEII